MKNKTFQSHLTKSYLLIVGAVFLVVSALLLTVRVRSTQEQIQDSIISDAELASSQFSFIVKNMSFLSTYTLSNTDINQGMITLSMDGQPDSKYLSAYNVVQSGLVNYSIVSSIYRITFFNENGVIACSDQYNIRYNAFDRVQQDVLDSITWIDKVQFNYGRAVLLPVQPQTFQPEAGDTLALVRAVRSPGKIVGYLIVDVPISEAEDLLDLGFEYSETLLFIDEEGEILYSHGDIPAAAESGVISASVDWAKEGYYYASVTDESQKLTTITLSPKSMLLRTLLPKMLTFLMEGTIFLIIAIGMILFVSRRLTQPLRLLSEQMDTFDLSSLQNHTDYSEYYKYAETATLYRAFKNMGERLNTLINREILWKTQQAEQQLRVLQAQINPHFMYNTLNVIGIMGIESKNTAIFEACRSFSNLMRYSISDKFGSISTVEEELGNLKDYLSLMQLRFDNMCEYKIIADESVSEKTLPRLTLQPFVENIFEHAFDGYTSIIHIRIETVSEEDSWYISISDDGCGITEEDLHKLKEHIKCCLTEEQPCFAASSGNGIGIRNSISRLYLLYHDSFSYDIESLSPGFRVTLRVNREETTDK